MVRKRKGSYSTTSNVIARVMPKKRIVLCKVTPTWRISEAEMGAREDEDAINGIPALVSATAGRDPTRIPTGYSEPDRMPVALDQAARLSRLLRKRKISSVERLMKTVCLTCIVINSFQPHLKGNAQAKLTRGNGAHRLP